MAWKHDIDISISLLKRLEECHSCTSNEAMLKDHITSLKHGIELLKWIPKIYIDRDLKWRIIVLARNVKQKLESFTHKLRDESMMNMDVNGAYADLREEMKRVIINKATDKYRINNDFLKLCSRLHHYRGKHDFLIEKITTLVTSTCKADQIAPLKKDLQDLQKMLRFLKPLVLYIDQGKLWPGLADDMSTALVTFQQEVAVFIYLSFVGKTEIEMVLSIKSNISRTIKEIDVWEMYTMILNKVYLNRVYLEDELKLLDNVILMLKSNIESFNAASSKLYEVLIDIHSFLIGLDPNLLLRKRHLLQPSFQAIIRHSIPIVCSCYLEHTHVDISTQLNCVLDLIKHIMSEAPQIKLYYFPRIDDLGFLEFFSGYLEDLMKNQEISRKRKIKALHKALHIEVHSLLCSAKVKNEELNETPWTDIINMSYQAEYIIDLYLSNSGDLRLVSSLSKIIEKLKNIRTDMNDLCKSLPAQDVAPTSKPKFLGTTTQVGDIDAIVGLQEEAESIKEYLLRGEKTLDVISIVGMAGIGKTTLASIVYKCPSMGDKFDILAWCSVSQCYKNRDLLLAILDQVNSFDKNHKSIRDDEELALLLCRSLKKRRYLIVLDDIWDNTLWGFLKRYLPDDSVSSRVLITTRNRDVADQIGSKVNELHGLTDENSWQLLQKKMLGKEIPGDLLKISKGIVEHCKGLPLTIVIIAGILSSIERTTKKWNLIAKSMNSLILSDPLGQCKAILELSYNHLPNHLRSCFLYLGLFPEDQEINVKRLINLWIVEGLVRETTLDSAEEVARKYMDELIAKSLVIPVKERSRGGVKTFRLHDLLHDFCLEKAKEKHFFTLLDKKNCSQPLQDPRRLILIAPHISDQHFSYHSIRSIICFHELNVSEIEKGIESWDMVLLRVMDVFGVWSKLFPNVSSLVHLRYLSLGLDNLGISTLPSSISKLQNLQILILRFAEGIKVPDLIWDMVKLRHIRISPLALFEVDGNRLENSSVLLENLRSLSRAYISCRDSNWLNKLSGLQRFSCIFVDEEHNDDGEYVEEDDDREEDDDLKANQVRALSFNGNLTSLKVELAAGSKQRFRNTCQLPNSLRKLTLSGFFLTSNDISDIGRAVMDLEVLKIYSCSVPFGYKWNVDDEEFPELKVLKLRNLPISKWIASEDSFLRLEQLWVEECNYLDEIPLEFGYLPNLRLITVRGCAPSVDASARKVEEMQHEQSNPEMRVRIYPRK